MTWEDFAHYKSGVYKHVIGDGGAMQSSSFGWGTSEEGEDYWVRTFPFPSSSFILFLSILIFSLVFFPFLLTYIYLPLDEMKGIQTYGATIVPSLVLLFKFKVFL